MTSEARLAIVDDDPFLTDQLRWALKGSFEISSATNAVEGLSLADRDPDVYLLDLRLPPSNEAEEGLGLLRAIRERRPEATVVVMTGEGERALALRAMELGAYDFFRKPFDPAELRLVLGRALERKKILAENRLLKEEVLSRRSFGKLVGGNRSMRELFRSIQKVAPADTTVLILGESGTGKELVAEAIHRGSARSRAAYIAVNGSALTESLAESELFGHEKGAFTGAVSSRAGKFEMAHGGTLFLDEVATFSAGLQAKLLRVLETRQFERVGGTRTVSVDIRLLAATNEDLQKRVKAGTFREDLFYRLNTVTLTIPPLRERTEDIPLLIDFFTAKWSEHHGKKQKTFSAAAMERLLAYRWPGNVRELEHLVEMLTLMVESDEVRPEDLPRSLELSVPGGAPAASPTESPFPEAVARFERDLLIRAIARSDGVKAQAARALGLDPNQMKYLCRKHGI